MSYDRNRLRENDRIRKQVNLTLYRIAFDYNPDINNRLHPVFFFFLKGWSFTHCKTLTFKDEAPVMCCLNGKVKLPELNAPPEPLFSLVAGTTTQSKHFLNNIRNYNTCFQMTSFSATNIISNNYMPRFRVKSIIRQYLCYPFLMINTNFCEFISLTIQTIKPINVVKLTKSQKER